MLMSRTKYLLQISKNIQNKLNKLAPQHIINSFIHHIKLPEHKRSTNKKQKLDDKLMKLTNNQTPKIKYNPDWLKNLTQIEKYPMMLQ